MGKMIMNEELGRMWNKLVMDHFNLLGLIRHVLCAVF
jgi:hypothetical protein